MLIEWYEAHLCAVELEIFLREEDVDGRVSGPGEGKEDGGWVRSSSPLDIEEYEDDCDPDRELDCENEEHI